MTRPAASPDIAAVRRFLARLAADNTKAFWEAHRADYAAALRDPAEALLAALAPGLEALTGHAVTPKLFRPHRDLRFSADKTPYHTHLHMIWRLAAGGRQDPAFFFGIGLDYASAGFGLMGFDPPVLADWRRMVELDGARIEAVIAAAEAQGFRLWEAELKRVPAPFPQDHPQGRLLRRKSLALSAELPEDADPATALPPLFAALLPVERMLASIL